MVQTKGAFLFTETAFNAHSNDSDNFIHDYDCSSHLQPKKLTYNGRQHWQIASNYFLYKIRSKFIDLKMLPIVY